MYKRISILLGLFLMLISISTHSAPMLTFETIKGEPKEYGSLIQQLRIKTYYPFPYLYNFTQDPNEEDISYYSSNHTYTCIARNKDKIVALAIGIPLINYNYDQFFASDHFKPYVKSEIKKYFLIDELLFEDELDLTKRYSIGKQLLLHIEEALLQSDFKYIAKLIIERPLNHPLRLQDYLDETKILKDINYISTNIVIPVPWTTRISENQRQYQNNPMRFWVKEIKKQ